MRPKFTLVQLLLLLYSALWAQPDSLYLYTEAVPGAIKNKLIEKEMILSDGSRVIRGVQNPMLYVHKPEQPNGTAVLICPGGGYFELQIDKEGHAIADWFAKRGVMAFVLKSRLPNDSLMTSKAIRPLQDAQKAMRLLRRNAREWKINPDRIGVVGFSSGGHLAAWMGTQFTQQVGELTDEAVSVRPSFMVLVYPAIGGMFKAMSDPLAHISGQTPPTFLSVSSDDLLIPAEGIVNFYLTLRKLKVPAELHLYEKGGHGYGLTRKNRGHVEEWDRELEGWLKDRKLL